jgi:hypothetical protein
MTRMKIVPVIRMLPTPAPRSSLTENRPVVKARMIEARAPKAAASVGVAIPVKMTTSTVTAMIPGSRRLLRKPRRIPAPVRRGGRFCAASGDESPTAAFLLFHRTMVTYPSAMRMPGTIPAMRSGPIETLATPPQRMASALGGNTIARPPAARIDPAESRVSYPADFICGSSVRLRSAVFAREEPERIPKALPPATATMGRRPGTRRRSLAISTMASCAILARNSTSPMRMNRGIAVNVKLLTELITLRLRRREVTSMSPKIRRDEMIPTAKMPKATGIRRNRTRIRARM